MNLVDALAWVMLPGLAAVGAGVLAWFIMQSRMEVALAFERERLSGQREVLAAQRGELTARQEVLETTIESAVRAAEESAKRQALDGFLADIHVERRCLMLDGRAAPANSEAPATWLTRAVRQLLAEGPEPVSSRRRLLLQERIFFREIPLSNWIEREIAVNDGADLNKMVRETTAFDSRVVNIAEIPRQLKAIGASTR